jgi:glycosyltransferase involved in cell wall biosynthesis
VIVTAATDSNGVGAAAGRPGDGLFVHLDAPLPTEISIGRGTALFVCGWCLGPQGRRIARLDLVVDGAVQRVDAYGMPRLDVLRALHPGIDPYDTAGMRRDPDSERDPELHAYRSGFWGTAQIVDTGRPAVEVLLRAELEGGGTATAELARIPLRASLAPVALAAPAPEAGPLIAVCMATYEPSMDLFIPQLESIRGQRHRNWICIVSDDCSSPQTYARIEAAIGDDPRFVVSRSPGRLGFYHNFERALSLVPDDVDYVAMSDQDDVWHPDKLEALLAAIGNAQLAYSDARIVAQGGDVLQDTYWLTRRNNHTSLLSLLVANSVTGAASLLRREVLDDALPFPPAQFAHFHDHWIALVALSLGEIAFVDRPIYDYVQHGEASLGHAAANQVPTLRSRLGGLRRDPRERVRMWRMHYFVDVARLTQVATVLLLRLGVRMPARKRKVLERWLRTDRSLAAMMGLWLRGARDLVGRTETLGAEWMLGYAFAWRRLLAITTRDRPTRGLRLDAVPPPTLAPKPGLRTPDLPQIRRIGQKIAPLDLAVHDDAPTRINLLIPNVDLEHFFGGYIAKFNLARRLAQRGLRVRVVTVDPQAPLPPDWRAKVEAYAGLDGVLDRVEVAFGREAQGGLEVSRSDRFIATTWWSAHVAHAASRSLDGEPFLYLIQEYEPFTFVPGTYAALAAQSYTFPHRALFSAELLREYFRRHGIGVYAAGADGDAASASFQNAITVVDPPPATELESRSPRRLLFYARPEPHASRNMYELGVLALQRAIELGAFGRGWQLHGIGTLESGRSLALGGGATLVLLPRAEQSSYAAVLRDHDVGLALMYTPHPSLVPIEMASAGMLTVTNAFENKTPAALGEISANLITTEATIDAIAAGLVAAAEDVGDGERRAEGARVNWSREWDRSFDDALLERVVGWLVSVDAGAPAGAGAG